MYEAVFETDWESLTRENAMFRAYALGVDAALGNDHPEELTRLVRETSRTLVQLAYDEGKSMAAEEIRNSDYDPAQEIFRPTENDWSIWDDLIEARRSDPESFELVDVPRSATDLPAALSRPAFLDRNDKPVESIRLPKFLFE